MSIIFTLHFFLILMQTVFTSMYKNIVQNDKQ